MDIILYHGTTSISAKKILVSGGIKPRNLTNLNNEAIETTTKQYDKIYLTRKKASAVSYGYDTIDDRGWYVKNNILTLPVVFSIDIDTINDPLYIDEDFLADDIPKEQWIKFLIDNKIIKDKSEYKNWLYYYNTNKNLAKSMLNKFSWKDSLKISGSITYKGIITLDKIKYIDIYYSKTGYKRIETITIKEFDKIYKECCNIIKTGYINKYKNENTDKLPTPYVWNYLKTKSNKLDNTVFKNISYNAFIELNKLAKKYKYQPFDKIILTKKNVYYMQYNTYIKLIKKSDDNVVIINLIDDKTICISCLNYIRNKLYLLKYKDTIEKFCKNKKIILELKYHDIKYFYNDDDFWDYVNIVNDKKIILPAKKE